MATRPGILHLGVSGRGGANALAVVLTLALALPAATAAQDDRPARDVCLRVEPVAGSLSASGLWRYTPKQMAKAIRQGTMTTVGRGTQCDEAWEPIVGTPRDGLVDVGETAWSRLEFHDGGRKVDVHFGNGVPECYGLDRVEVTTSDAGLDVRVFTGDLPPGEIARGCDAPRLPWVTTVDLGERLAFGSSGEDREVEIAWQQEVQALKMEAVHELSERLPGYIRFVPHESDLYEEDFRFTAEGRRYALQFFKNPETTGDDLVNFLLKREGLQPTYPPYPGQETGPSQQDPALEDAPSVSPPPTPEPTPFRNEGSRVPWQEAPDRMYQVTLQPEYAGWYLDTDRERLPVLMWAGDLDEAGALLIEVFGEDASFEVRPADRTWTELKEIADQVSDMRSRFDERGILLVETEYDVKRNRIDVGIKATKKKQAVAERMLAELGDAVRVRRVDVPQFDS